MEKLLNWINSDIQEARANGSTHGFAQTGIFYASAMIALYLIKCSAEISQKYCTAGLYCDSRIMTQSYVINRVTSLKPGSSKYFDISRITKMLTEDSDIMGSHTYLRANIIVRIFLLNFMFLLTPSFFLRCWYSTCSSSLRTSGMLG